MIEKYAPNIVALILVANFDVNEEYTVKDSRSVVIPRHERYKLAQTIGAQYVEVSVDEGYGWSNLVVAIKSICLPQKEYKKCIVM